MRRDILSAYAASGSRVVSWVIVSALVYRSSPAAFAMLALVRGTIGILNYAALGLLPAMIRMLANRPKVTIDLAVAAPVHVAALDDPIHLGYVTPQTTKNDLRPTLFDSDEHTQRTFSTGMAIAFVTALTGVIATVLCAMYSPFLYSIPAGFQSDDMQLLILGMGFGIALRWFTEPAGAVLQTHQHITLDNVVLIGTEVCWVLLVAAESFDGPPSLAWIGVAFFASGFITLLGRSFAPGIGNIRYWSFFDPQLFRPLLTTGLLITLAQLADYLYSPTDYLLINHLLTPLDLAHYAPAVQIDSGLLLLVTALGSVLLPKTALAHAAGSRAVVRTYYLRGTLASMGMLVAAAVIIYFASPLIFRLWFGDAMPGTVAILPLVLLNTVIGGSSAVGRAILIGIGKTKPFTISVLIAGVTNVIASLIFVRYFHLGLNGIILGTIVAVVFRCGIWMPWYVLRELRIK